MMTAPSNTRSRLLRLPCELRRTIYQQLFRGQKILIDPTRDIRRHDTSVSPEDRKLPGLLFTSKLLRAEALPVFSRCATAVFYADFKHRSCDIPAYYLRGVRRAILTDWYIAGFSSADTPKLEELVIQRYHRVFATPQTNTHIDSSFKAAINALRINFENLATDGSIQEVAKSQTGLAIVLEALLEVRGVVYVSSHGKYRRTC